MYDIEEMRRTGLSISAMSELTHFDRKRIRKYLQEQEAVRGYGTRTPQPSKLDPFKPYLEDRLKTGVWNAQVLLRELRDHGYSGGYTILKEWLHPQRQAAYATAVRRFETPPAKHYGESRVMVRTRRRPAFGAGAAALVLVSHAT